jgi:ATP-dependent DNA ligase
MGENLDLLVLGGWWGKGGRTGKISVLLCGLRVPQEDDGSGETPQWVNGLAVEKKELYGRGGGLRHTDSQVSSRSDRA